MPSTGAPARRARAAPRRDRARAALPSPTRPSRRPAAPRGRRRRDVVGDARAEAPERERDRADVAGAVVADGDVHSDALRRRDALALDAHGRPQRAADRLERRLGDVVLVASGRLDVDREPAGLREAAKHVHREPRSRSSRSSPRGRPPRSTAARASASSIGTTASPYRAIPRRSPSAAVERLAERERGVLGRVVVAGLEVAGALEDQVEARVEGELLEKVVVEPGARRDPDARAPSSASRTAMRVSAVARRRRTRVHRLPRPATAGRARVRAPRAAGRRPRGRGSRYGSPSGEDAHGEPLAQQRVAEHARLVDGHEEEVRRARGAARARARAARAQAALAPPRPASRRAATRARRARAPRRARRPGTAPGAR